MNQQLIASIKKEAETLSDLSGALIAQIKTNPFDVGKVSISLTAVGDSIEKIEDMLNEDNDVN